ncbi:MAG TPA: GDYXXLXY domain-containing protein [Luteitalea sp.]|nr:GDYXXLXY domain-containing protein [Luteitalea sp.]
MIARVLIVVGLLASLGLTGWEVARKERLLKTGETIVLELAPVDPRSLMQGDYMRLDYAIGRRVESAHTWPRDGAVIVRNDERGVAEFVRRDEGQPLQTGEHRLTYRRRGTNVRVGTDAFYFQEGTADVYASARYGEMRVGEDGTSVLVGLRDANLEAIGR